MTSHKTISDDVATALRQDREAFCKEYHPRLDLTEISDAWGYPMFKHPHVESMWQGWRDGRIWLRAPPQKKPAPDAMRAMENRRVTICGSARFADEIDRVNRHLSLRGHTVYSIVPHLRGPNDEQKQTLRAVHRAKIDASDAIYVVALGGYIGPEVAAEIEYAKAADKVVLDIDEYGLASAHDLSASVLPPDGAGERTAPDSCPHCFNESDCSNIDICNAVASSPGAAEPDEFGYFELGRSFYEEFTKLSNDGNFEGFICGCSPVQILVHLINERDEALAAPSSPPDDVRSALAVDGPIAQEMHRIKRLFEEKSGAAEDLISYATEVASLRSAPVSAAPPDGVRSLIVEACDLLAERKQGNPARSAGHNARLALEAALRLIAAPPVRDRDVLALVQPILKAAAQGYSVQGDAFEKATAESSPQDVGREATVSARDAVIEPGEIIEATVASNPYTDYSFVAQNSAVEKTRATKYARMIAREAIRSLAQGAKP